MKYRVLLLFVFTVLFVQLRAQDTLYSVQLGAFKKEVAKDNFMVKDLNLIRTHDSLYVYTSGSFKTFNAADAYRKELQAKGQKDAFVVGIKDKKRILLEVNKSSAPASSGPVVPATAPKADTANHAGADSAKAAVPVIEDEGLSKVDEQTASTKKINTDQVNCVSLIKDADELYHSGEYDRCLSLLENGMKDCHLSKREREDAWIIRARVNLEKDNIPETDHALIKLMSTNPNFKPKEGAYQEDFYTRLNKISVRPMLSLGLHFGFNDAIYSNAKTYSVLEGVDYSAPYKSSPGYDVGGYVEFEFLNNISVNLGLDYSSLSYTRNLQGAVNNFSAMYNENLSYLSTPLYLKKYFGAKAMKPFIILGMNYSMLRRAVADISVQYTATDPTTNESDHFSISGNSIDQRPLRTDAIYGIVVGAGCSRRIKNFMFHADGRYVIGMNYFTNSFNRLNNEELILKYYYIDNAVTINKIQVSVSVAYIFHYHVKTLRK